jgi:hypothetical protein
MSLLLNKSENKRMVKIQLSAMTFRLFTEWERRLMGGGDDDTEVILLPTVVFLSERVWPLSASPRHFSLMKFATTIVTMSRITR